MSAPGNYFGIDCYAYGDKIGLSHAEVDTAYQEFSRGDADGKGVIPLQSLASGDIFKSILGGKFDAASIGKIVTGLLSGSHGNSHGSHESNPQVVPIQSISGDKVQSEGVPHSEEGHHKPNIVGIASGLLSSILSRELEDLDFVVNQEGDESSRSIVIEEHSRGGEEGKKKKDKKKKKDDDEDEDDGKKKKKKKKDDDEEDEGKKKKGKKGKKEDEDEDEGKKKKDKKKKDDDDEGKNKKGKKGKKKEEEEDDEDEEEDKKKKNKKNKKKKEEEEDEEEEEEEEEEEDKKKKKSKKGKKEGHTPSSKLSQILAKIQSIPGHCNFPEFLGLLAKVKNHGK